MTFNPGLNQNSSFSQLAIFSADDPRFDVLLYLDATSLQHVTS